MARNYEDFRAGVRAFTDVRITVGSSGNKKAWAHGKSIADFAVRFMVKMEKVSLREYQRWP